MSKPIKIFISSPGDVKTERAITRTVINRVASELGIPISIQYSTLLQTGDTGIRIVEKSEDSSSEELILCPYFWEYQAFHADEGYQSQIPRTDQFDLVVSILWNRMGSKLSANFTNPDGSIPASGTEYEVQWAKHQRQKHFNSCSSIDAALVFPALHIYRNRSDRTPPSNTKEGKAFFDQKEQLETFVENWTRDSDGSFKGAFNSYRDLGEFERLFEAHLRDFLQGFLPKTEKVKRVVPPPRWSIHEKGSPFRSLSVYNLEHEPIFSGRSKSIGETVEALRRQAESGNSTVLLVGGSGSGKSSLAQAGVLPMLITGETIEGIGVWRYAVMRPRDRQFDGNPCRALAAALQSVTAFPDLRDKEVTSEVAQLDKLTSQLTDNPSGIVDRIEDNLGRVSDDDFKERKTRLERIIEAFRSEGRQGDEEAAKIELKKLTPSKARIVLIVDQLEELFLQFEEVKKGPSSVNDTKVFKGGADPFLVALSRIANSNKIFVILTLRSDFYHHYQSTPELVGLIGETGKVDVFPPEKDELGQIIRQPAAAAGLRYEEHPETGKMLDEELRDKAFQNPEALPLLSYLLDLLVNKQKERNDGLLRWKDYDDLGRIEGALSEHAESFFDLEVPEPKLTKAERDAFPRVLSGLVRFGKGANGEKVALKEEARLKDLIEDGAGKEIEGARNLIETLAGEEARLLTLNSDSEAAESTFVSISHEILLRNWKKIQIWLDENKQSLQLRDRIEAMRLQYQAARNSETEWAADSKLSGCPDDYLLSSGLPLREGNSLLKNSSLALSSEIRDFIELSNQRNSRKNRNRFLIGILSMSVIGVLAYLTVSGLRSARNAELESAELVNRSQKEKGHQSFLRAIEKWNQEDARGAVLHFADAIEADPSNRGFVAGAMQFLHSDLGEKMLVPEKIFALEKDLDTEIHLSDNGKWAVTLFDSRIHLWSAKDGSLVAAWDTTSSIRWMEIHPDGERLAWLDDDGALMKVDLRPDSTPLRFMLSEEVSEVVLSDDWNAAVGIPSERVEGFDPTSVLRKLAASKKLPNERASASEDNGKKQTLFITWMSEPGADPHFVEIDEGMSTIVFSPNGEFVIVSQSHESKNTTSVFSALSGHSIWKNEEGGGLSQAFWRDSKTAVLVKDQKILFLDCEGGSEKQFAMPVEGNIAVSPDGDELILASSRDARVGVVQDEQIVWHDFDRNSESEILSQGYLLSGGVFYLKTEDGVEFYRRSKIGVVKVDVDDPLTDDYSDAENVVSINGQTVKDIRGFTMGHNEDVADVAEVEKGYTTASGKFIYRWKKGAAYSWGLGYKRKYRAFPGHLPAIGKVYSKVLSTDHRITKSTQGDWLWFEQDLCGIGRKVPPGGWMKYSACDVSGEFSIGGGEATGRGEAVFSDDGRAIYVFTKIDGLSSRERISRKELTDRITIPDSVTLLTMDKHEPWVMCLTDQDELYASPIENWEKRVLLSKLDVDLGSLMRGIPDIFPFDIDASSRTALFRSPKIAGDWIKVWKWGEDGGSIGELGVSLPSDLGEFRRGVEVAMDGEMVGIYRQGDNSTQNYRLYDLQNSVLFPELEYSDPERLVEWISFDGDETVALAEFLRNLAPDSDQLGAGHSPKLEVRNVVFDHGYLSAAAERVESENEDLGEMLFAWIDRFEESEESERLLSDSGLNNNSSRAKFLKAFPPDTSEFNTDKRGVELIRDSFVTEAEAAEVPPWDYVFKGWCHLCLGEFDLADKSFDLAGDELMADREGDWGYSSLIGFTSALLKEGKCILFLHRDETEAASELLLFQPGLLGKLSGDGFHTRAMPPGFEHLEWFSKLCELVPSVEKTAKIFSNTYDLRKEVEAVAAGGRIPGLDEYIQSMEILESRVYGDWDDFRDMLRLADLYALSGAGNKNAQILNRAEKWIRGWILEADKAGIPGSSGLSSLASVLDRKGDKQGSLEAWRRACSLSTHYSKWMEASEAAIKMGDVGEAIVFLAGAIDSFDGLTTTFETEKGWLHWQTGETAEAESEWLNVDDQWNNPRMFIYDYGGGSGEQRWKTNLGMAFSASVRGDSDSADFQFRLACQGRDDLAYEAPDVIFSELGELLKKLRSDEEFSETLSQLQSRLSTQEKWLLKIKQGQSEDLDPKLIQNFLRRDAKQRSEPSAVAVALFSEFGRDSEAINLLLSSETNDSPWLDSSVLFRFAFNQLRQGNIPEAKRLREFAFVSRGADAMGEIIEQGWLALEFGEMEAANRCFREADQLDGEGEAFAPNRYLDKDPWEHRRPEIRLGLALTEFETSADEDVDLEQLGQLCEVVHLNSIAAYGEPWPNAGPSAHSIFNRYIQKIASIPLSRFHEEGVAPLEAATLLGSIGRYPESFDILLETEYPLSEKTIEKIVETGYRKLYPAVLESLEMRVEDDPGNLHFVELLATVLSERLEYETVFALLEPILLEPRKENEEDFSERSSLLEILWDVSKRTKQDKRFHSLLEQLENEWEGDLYRASYLVLSGFDLGYHTEVINAEKQGWISASTNAKSGTKWSIRIAISAWFEEDSELALSILDHIFFHHPELASEGALEEMVESESLSEGVAELREKWVKTGLDRMKKFDHGGDENALMWSMGIVADRIGNRAKSAEIWADLINAKTESERIALELNQNPSFQTLYRNLAFTLRNSGDLEGAGDAAINAVAINPTSLSALRELAISLEETDRKPEVLEACCVAMAASDIRTPNDVIELTRLAFRVAGEESLAPLEKAVPSVIAEYFYYEAGKQLLSEEKYELALAYFVKEAPYLHDEMKQLAENSLHQAVCHQMLRDREPAIAAFLSALRNGQEVGADSESTLKDHSAVVALRDHVQKLNGRDLDVILREGDSAEEIFSLAFALADFKNFDTAVRVFRELEGRPDLSDEKKLTSISKIIECHVRGDIKGSLSKEFRQFEALIKEPVAPGEDLDRMVELLFNCWAFDDSSEVPGIFDRILDEQRVGADAFGHIGYLRALNGQVIGEDWLAEGTRRFGRDPELLDWYAWILFNEGQMDSAKSATETLDESFSSSLIQSAIYHELGKFDIAVEYYGRAVEYAPAFKESSAFVNDRESLTWWTKVESDVFRNVLKKWREKNLDN